MDDMEKTRLFSAGDLEKALTTETILLRVKRALEDKGYRAVDQLVGYLVSGDPAYITSHHDARVLIRAIERDELLEEIVQFYLDHLEEGERAR